MRFLAMIQARCGSTRLPNKVLMDLCGKPSLQWMIERVQRSKQIDEAMVITSIEKSNLPILKLCADMGVRVGIGSEEDVLDRYYQTAKLLRPEYIIRLTGDCPCVDPDLIDLAISKMDGDTDYCGNSTSATFADGLDIEIIKFSALERSWKEAVHSFEREHVTQYIIRHKEQFHYMDFLSPIGYFGDHRWTVDEPEDFEVVKKIYEYFLYEEKNDNFGYRDILQFLNCHTEIKSINNKFQRNEGLQKSINEDVIIAAEDVESGGLK